jgi:hypothetical protein
MNPGSMAAREQQARTAVAEAQAFVQGAPAA